MTEETIIIKPKREPFNLHLVDPHIKRFGAGTFDKTYIILQHIQRALFHFKYGDPKPEGLNINFEYLKRETGLADEKIIERIKWLQETVGGFEIETE